MKLKIFPYFLVLYHLTFAYIAYRYVAANNGDAVRYWWVGENLSEIQWTNFLHPGTDVVKLFTFPLVKFLHLPLFAGCLLFSAISAWGFWRLSLLLAELTKKSNAGFLMGCVLLLLPNLHFWTSLTGKEALLLPALVLLAEQVYRKKYFSAVFFIALAFIAIIRPHAAFVLLLAWTLSLLYKGGLNTFQKLGLAASFSGGVAVLYLILNAVSGAQSGLLDKIQRLYKAHNLKLKNTSAYVPLEDYSYPYKLWTFYFRPLPLEKQGLYFRILEFENIVFLCICMVILFLALKNIKCVKLSFFMVFAGLVLLLYGSMYVYAYANFGLIVRTRALVSPFFYLLLLSFGSQFSFSGKFPNSSKN